MSVILDQYYYCRQITYMYINFKYPISVIYIIRKLRLCSTTNDNIHLKCKKHKKYTCNQRQSLEKILKIDHCRSSLFKCKIVFEGSVLPVFSVLCVFFLVCLCSDLLPVSLDCPFLFAPSVFFKFYLQTQYLINTIERWYKMFLFQFEIFFSTYINGTKMVCFDFPFVRLFGVR